MAKKIGKKRNLTPCNSLRLKYHVRKEVHTQVVGFLYVLVILVVRLKNI